MSTKSMALVCQISRGGFSDERVFEIRLTNSSFSGIAFRAHLWNTDGTPLGEGEPPIGNSINGFVAVRIIKITDGKALVSVPDGEVIEVPTDKLEARPAEIGNHVSV